MRKLTELRRNEKNQGQLVVGANTSTTFVRHNFYLFKWSILMSYAVKNLSATFSNCLRFYRKGNKF